MQEPQGQDGQRPWPSPNSLSPTVRPTNLAPAGRTNLLLGCCPAPGHGRGLQGGCAPSGLTLGRRSKGAQSFSHGLKVRVHWRPTNVNQFPMGPKRSDMSPKGQRYGLPRERKRFSDFLRAQKEVRESSANHTPGRRGACSHVPQKFPSAAVAGLSIASHGRACFCNALASLGPDGLSLCGPPLHFTYRGPQVRMTSGRSGRCRSRPPVTDHPLDCIVVEHVQTRNQNQGDGRGKQDTVTQ